MLIAASTGISKFPRASSRNLVIPGDNGAVALTLRAPASATVNTQEWQNGLGSVIASVDKDGRLTAANLTITGFSGVLKTTAGVVAGGASTSDVPEGSNLYYTDARARAAITGTTNRIAVTSGVVDIASTYAGQNTITTLGTIGTGTWQGTAIADSYISSASTWNAKEPAITAGTTGQYWRGDKSWQTLDKAAVGLGNVENTALSTWAGTSSITTVGTIGTGTWNATAIADGKIASALTGKTYNGLTLTAAAVGFTIAGGTTSKTLTVPLDASVSGTNTGDQTTISGNAGTATALQTARNINGVAFNGTADITVTAAAGTLTGTTLNATVVTSSLTAVGTIATGTWQGTSISTTYTDAKVKTVTGTLNRLSIGGTATDPTFDISTSYEGQNTITTLGTIGTGTWNATAIADAKIAAALTGKTYNGLTLTAAAVGFTVAGGTTSKTLTVPLDASVSGTNTGDQTITLTGGVTGSGTGSFAATVVTNANLTGPITSVGNATAIASQTGTGTTFVMSAGPTITGTLAAAAGTYSSTLAVTGVQTNGADFVFSASGSMIRSNTSDGADTSVISITGGGSNSGSRGGTIQLYGNEHASLPGVLRQIAGDITGSSYQLYTASTLRLQVNHDGTGSYSGGTFTFNPAVSITSVTDSTTTTTGALIVSGGIGVAKALWVGGLVNMASTLAVTGNFSINTSKFKVNGADGRTAWLTSVDASTAVYLSPNSFGLTGVSQNGILVDWLSDSGATNRGTAIFSRLNTPASAFTMTTGIGLQIADSAKGAGSTITTLYGLKVESQTQGGTNYAIYTSSGTVRLGDAVTMSSTLAVTGDFSINSTKFTVTASSGNTSVAGTLTVTGAITANSSGSGTSSALIASSAAPTLTMISTGSGADAKNWDFQVSGNTMAFRTRTDANGSGTDWLTVTRSGTTVSSAAFATAVTMSSTLGVTGNFSINTSKFTVTASSGNTSVAGTLAVTGTALVGPSGTANPSSETADLTITAGTAGDVVASLTQRGFRTTDTAFAANYAYHGSNLVGRIQWFRDGADDAGKWTVWTKPTGGSLTQRLSIDSAGLATFSDSLGIGAAPISDLHVNISRSSTVLGKIENTNNSNAAAHARLEIANAGSSGGDSLVLLRTTGLTDWSLGLDNDDSDKFKISNSSSVGASTWFQVDTAGVVTIPGTLAVAGVASMNNTTDSTSVSSGSLVVAGGIGVAKRLTLDGSSNKTLRIVNGVANGTTATTLGSKGPTGSTAGDPQGWMRVDINGTDRYIPYW